MTRIKAILDRHFLAFTTVACILLGLIFAAGYLQVSVGPLVLPNPSWSLSPAVDDLLKGNRAAVYGTLASINGSLLGFAIAVTSIVLSLSENNRMRRLKDSSQYRVLWQTLTRTTKALGIATLVSLACLLFDREQASNRVLVVALVPVMASIILFLARTLWILDKIIDLITMPPAARVSDVPQPVLHKA